MNEVASFNCCVGNFLNDSCHSTRFSSKKFYHAISDFSEKDVKLLYLRVPGIKNIENEKICNYHYDNFYTYYSSLETKCCNPFQKHSKNITKNLVSVTLDFYEEMKNCLSLEIIPGKKICANCSTKIRNDIDIYKDLHFKYCVDAFQKHRVKTDTELVTLDNQAISYLKEVLDLKIIAGQKVCVNCDIKLKSDILHYENNFKTDKSLNYENLSGEASSEPSEEIKNTPEFTTESQEKRKLEHIFDAFDLPTFKRQKLNESSIKKKGVEILQSVVDKTSETFEIALKVELPKFNNLQKINNESSWFLSMISNIQIKYNSPETSYNEKIELLTFLPDEWNLNTVNIYLKCTRYQFEEMKKLKESGSTHRVKKNYHRISLEVRENIKNYYLDDANSAMCSGTKEKISVRIEGERQLLQKRYLLYDIKLLYKNWVSENSSEKIPCLAFFFAQKPEQCVSAGSSGSHNICICPTHQNVKLKLSAVQPKMNYHELLDVSVCSVENKDCMLHKCQDCPNKQEVYKFLTQNISNPNKMVKYSSWGAEKIQDEDGKEITRTTLLNLEKPMLDIIEELSNDVWSLSEHHFISNEQKEFYSKSKKNLDEKTGLITMDFAENYPFICQNSVQAFYFNNTHASLFTLTLHYKDPKDELLKVASYCVISDGKDHSAGAIHLFLKTVLDSIKQEYTFIKSLIYYSDGAPQQFKNKNHFINLLFHKKDYKLELKSYNFFGTSHGKTSCDGIGAVAKRAARRASLQHEQILNAEQMCEYLKKNVQGIRFLYVSNGEVKLSKQKLERRFELVKTVQNTKKYHCIEPINDTTMRFKLYSEDVTSKSVKMI